jgi:integrase
VHAALLTGARYGELSRLRVEDFEFDSTVHVLKSKPGRERHVVLSDQGIAFFRKLTAGRAGKEIMLRNFGRANLTWMRGDQQLHISRACAAAHVDICFHALRHTYASNAIMVGGMSLMLLAKNLGHADTTMVQKHYGHLVCDYVFTATKKSVPVFGFAFDDDDNVMPLRRAMN